MVTESKGKTHLEKYYEDYEYASRKPLKIALKDMTEKHRDLIMTRVPSDIQNGREEA